MAFISLILIILMIALVVAMIVVYIMLANKVAKEARNRGESYGFYLFAGIFLSPLLTAIVREVNLLSAELLKDLKALKEAEKGGKDPEGN